MKGFVLAKYVSSIKAWKAKTEKTVLKSISPFRYLVLEANHKLSTFTWGWVPPWVLGNQHHFPCLVVARSTSIVCTSDCSTMCQDGGEAVLQGQREPAGALSWFVLHTVKPCWHLLRSSGQGERRWAITSFIFAKGEKENTPKAKGLVSWKTWSCWSLSKGDNPTCCGSCF